MQAAGQNGQATKKKKWPWVVAFSAVVGIVGTGFALAAALAVIAVVALIVIAVFVYVVAVLLFSPIYHGDPFIEALAADNDQVAYALLCPSLKEELTFDEFFAGVAPAKPVLRTEVSKAGGGFGFGPITYTVTYYFEDNTLGMATYVAEEEEGNYGDAYICEASAVTDS